MAALRSNDTKRRKQIGSFNYQLHLSQQLFTFNYFYYYYYYYYNNDYYYYYYNNYYYYYYYYNNYYNSI